MIWILGEARHNLTMKELEKFLKQYARAQKHLIGVILFLLSRSSGGAGTRPKSRNSSALFLWQINLNRCPYYEKLLPSHYS